MILTIFQLEYMEAHKELFKDFSEWKKLQFMLAYYQGCENNFDPSMEFLSEKKFSDVKRYTYTSIPEYIIAPELVMKEQLAVYLDQLVYCMTRRLNTEHVNRPTTDDLLRDPLFWSEETTAAFLRHMKEIPETRWVEEELKGLLNNFLTKLTHHIEGGQYMATPTSATESSMSQLTIATPSSASPNSTSVSRFYVISIIMRNTPNRFIRIRRAFPFLIQMAFYILVYLDTDKKLQNIFTDDKKRQNIYPSQHYASNRIDLIERAMMKQEYAKEMGLDSFD
eukprot:TRINITY_DN687_c0_g1_i2.p1 TRINITY_DN687_c0_g1~~TRINITY_DN687_c0_g1_i2.p1  ORF type:complete len:280 (-),score=37.21 TRINITY_DN687_c0_g1_i2:49-888(-)